VCGVREHFSMAMCLGFCSLYLLRKFSVWRSFALCLEAVVAFNVCCITIVRRGDGDRGACGKFVTASAYDIVTC
jgi:EamA domain-containing membrane protein RarD